MRFISWNMGCAPPMATNYRRRHEAAWRYLVGELKPDVAMVQEAMLTATPIVSEAGQMFWSGKKGSETGTAVFVRNGLSAEQVAAESMGSYVAAVDLSTPIGTTRVASVHVGPPAYRLHLQTLANELSALVAGKRFVIAGDLNAARHIDNVYKGRWYTRFFEDLERREFYDCHWRQHGKEVQSFWGRQAKHAYQCDHIFVDAATGEGTPPCDIIDNPLVRELSDHGPIRLETNG